MSQEISASPEIKSRGSNSWTNGQTSSQTSGQKRRINKRVHFSHSTTVRMIDNPDSFTTKFRNFKRCFIKTLPCLNIEVAPFREYKTATDFEEKKGDLAKIGMPPKKRGSIGEIDLSELKSQLERMHTIAEHMAHSEEKLAKFQSMDSMSSDNKLSSIGSAPSEDKLESVHNVEH